VIEDAPVCKGFTAIGVGPPFAGRIAAWHYGVNVTPYQLDGDEAETRSRFLLRSRLQGAVLRSGGDFARVSGGAREDGKDAAVKVLRSSLSIRRVRIQRPQSNKLVNDLFAASGETHLVEASEHRGDPRVLPDDAGLGMEWSRAESLEFDRRGGIDPLEAAKIMDE